MGTKWATDSQLSLVKCHSVFPSHFWQLQKEVFILNHNQSPFNPSLCWLVQSDNGSARESKYSLVTTMQIFEDSCLKMSPLTLLSTYYFCLGPSVTGLQRFHFPLGVLHLVSIDLVLTPLTLLAQEGLGQRQSQTGMSTILGYPNVILVFLACYAIPAGDSTNWRACVFSTLSYSFT